MLERLARGGMSTVYRALDERLDRPVAVKVMSAALSSDPAFADRFAREARVAAKLSHLNAVAVYDQGSDGEHVFLVMELVRGRTLRDLLRERGVLNPAQAVSIMEPVLGALAAAHRAGLVHRDVKPENILLSDDGAVKVADFGLARAIEADASSTRTGLMMGTVAYCPPEQIARGSADARSDVYSAGIVLFELLTGSPPYTGDSAMAVAYQHVNSDVPPPSSRRAGIPRQLDEIVLRATSREQSGRPLDAGALLAELHDIRVDLGLPVVAVPPRRPPAGDLADTQQIDRVPAHPSVPPYPPPTGRGRPAGPPGQARPRGAEAPTAPTHGNGFRAGATQHTAIQQRDAAELATKHAHQAPSRRRRARRRAALIALLILLLGLLTGWGTWYLAVGRYHQVPNLTGQAQSGAVQELRNDGFTVDPAFQQAYSETVPSGSVIGTHPDVGSHLLGGKSVQLVVSRGKERYAVPAVVGKSYDQATQAFAGQPVQLKRSDLADDTGKIPAGTVIRTDPAAATQVKRDAIITIYVSSGPPMVGVPNVTGQSQADASSTLSQASFTVTVAQAFSDKVPAGSVISQNPTGSALVRKFSAVRLVVSKGPPTVTIPDIPKGSDPGDAAQALQSLGLQVQVVRKDKGLFDFSGYKVDNLNPPAGTVVQRGSTVTMTVR